MPRDIPADKKGAAPHTPTGADATRRYQNSVPGGNSVEPHPNRNEDPLREKIERMKRKARFSDPIG